jgi:dTDP-4-amino-4,6-dideoxygalactose transaminase
MKYKLFKPYMSWRARWYVLKVLMGTQLAEGPLVKQFESEFAKYFNLQRNSVVAVNSGTSALELAYECANIGPGDEVITPVLTCTATNLPLVRRGATIVFADITRHLLMDPADVRKRITPKTKAIVYVDFGGASATLKEIAEIAKEHNLTLIQDSAQSFGPYFQPLGDYVCMSFQAIKTLTCGDGGMLICKDTLMAKHAKKLRWFGYDRDEKQKHGDTDLTDAGYKMHMNDISAAIGLGNLRSIGKALRKRTLASTVFFHAGLPLLCYPWLTIILHPQATRIKDELAKHGIETGQHHYRNDKYAIFGGRRTDLPMMDAMEEQYLLIPYHHDISMWDAKKICALVAYYLWKSV